MPREKKSNRNIGRPCFYCMRPMLESKQTMTREERDQCATRDHVIPRDVGGSNDAYNIVICCARCNNLKAETPYEAFLGFAKAVLRKYPYAETMHLRKCYTIYLNHLVAYAAQNHKVVNQSLSLALLRMADTIT